MLDIVIYAVLSVVRSDNHCVCCLTLSMPQNCTKAECVCMRAYVHDGLSEREIDSIVGCQRLLEES